MPNARCAERPLSAILDKVESFYRREPCHYDARAPKSYRGGVKGTLVALASTHVHQARRAVTGSGPEPRTDVGGRVLLCACPTCRFTMTRSRWVLD